MKGCFGYCFGDALTQSSRRHLQAAVKITRILKLFHFPCIQDINFENCLLANIFHQSGYGFLWQIGVYVLYI